jgi:hypothetical protein
MSEKKNPIEIVVKMPVGTTGGFYQFEPIRDEEGMVNLTDLWKRFGATPNRDPRQWSRKEGKEFLTCLSSELNVPVGHIYRGQRGRGGSSHAHWQAAMTYLQYLSPEAQMMVNRIVRERIEEEHDPELGVRRAVERHTRRLKASGRSDEDVEKRLKTVARRNTLTSTLERHGVRGCKDPNRNGFAGVTNALYLGWKGMTAPDLRRELGVPAGGNLRDRLDGFDLDQLAFAEAMLERKVRQQNLYGADECSRTAHSVGKAVGLLIEHVLG